MALRDLDEFFDPTFDLPIRGKVYAVKSPDAATGLLAQRLLVNGLRSAAGEDLSPQDIAALELSDDDERDLYPRILGDCYGQMVKDNIPWEMIKHAALTIFMWVGYNREAAETFWESAASSGESQRPEPQDHKAPARKAAASPRSRASSNGKQAAVKATSSPSPASS
jgi:hypothetical protein